MLYSGLAPQRQRHHDDLIGALQAVQPVVVDLTGWSRIADVRYNETPLSACGSLLGIGGRFNVGATVDNAIGAPWPALYVAADFETAYREKFGLVKGSNVDGLTGGEFALRPGNSFSEFQVKGHLGLVLDLTQPGVLDPIVKVLARFSLPNETVPLRRRLGIPNKQLSMVRSA